jgi:hypothetical protein
MQKGEIFSLKKGDKLFQMDFIKGEEKNECIYDPYIYSIKNGVLYGAEY